MNLKMFKITMMTLLLAGILSSCAKKEKEKENEEKCTISTCIYGKWKMEKAVFPFLSGIVNVPEYIVYEFHPDGIFTVTAATEEIMYGSFLPPGEYPYSIFTGAEMTELYNDPFYSTDPNSEWFAVEKNTMFGTFFYIYTIYFSSSKEMQMSCYSYSDSDSYIFKKINH